MSVMNKTKLAALVTAAAVTLAGCSGGKEEGAATDTKVTTPVARSTILPPTTTTPATRTTTSGTGVGDPTNQQLLDAVNASKTELGAKADAAKASADAAKASADAGKAEAMKAKDEAAGAKKEAKKAKSTALITGIVASALAAAGVGFGIWNLNRTKNQGEETRQKVQDAGDANLIATRATGAAISGQVAATGTALGELGGVSLDEQRQAEKARQKTATEQLDANKAQITATNAAGDSAEASRVAAANANTSAIQVAGKVDKLGTELDDNQKRLLEAISKLTDAQKENKVALDNQKIALEAQVSALAKIEAGNTEIQASLQSLKQKVSETNAEVLRTNARVLSTKASVEEILAREFKLDPGVQQPAPAVGPEPAKPVAPVGASTPVAALGVIDAATGAPVGGVASEKPDHDVGFMGPPAPKEILDQRSSKPTSET